MCARVFAVSTAPCPSVGQSQHFPLRTVRDLDLDLNVRVVIGDLEKGFKGMEKEDVERKMGGDFVGICGGDLI